MSDKLKYALICIGVFALAVFALLMRPSALSVRIDVTTPAGDLLMVNGSTLYPDVLPPTPTMLDINTCSEIELITFVGIEEKLSRDIIAYRDKHGKFSRIEDIMKIPGIGKGKFEKIKDRICVS